MANAGALCNTLKASGELKTCLGAAGIKQHFNPAQFLFREDSKNTGVFLVVKGRVRMSVETLPKLDRLFAAGSVLGLPSTFTGRPYSLTAQASTDADVMHVTPEAFLDLMRQRPDLCREATEILGREVTFIQSALAERRRQAAALKKAPAQLWA